MPLTEVQIRNLKPKDRPYKKFDGNGLYVIVKPDGKKLWRKKYYYNGKERTHTVGWYPTVTLKEARKERAKVQEQLDRGLDPSLEKKRESGGLDTFYDVAKEWWELNSGITVDLLKKEKYDHRTLAGLVDQRRNVWNTKHAVKIWRRLEKYVLTDLGSHAINKIKAIDVRRVLEAVVKKGVTDVPKRILQYMNHVFVHALIHNSCDANPCSGLNQVLPKYKVEHRKSLSMDELPDFFDAMKESKSDLLVILAIKLLVLTCVRSRELRFAEWKEFDFEQNMWVIPAQRMKTNREHKVPLTKQMLNIICEIKKLSNSSVFLFPSVRAKDGVIGENTLNVAIDRVGYKGKVTPHGFRATAKTAWTEAGFSDLASELQLAHIDKNQVRGAYNYKTELLEERQNMMKWYSEKLVELGLITVLSV